MGLVHGDPQDRHRAAPARPRRTRLRSPSHPGRQATPAALGDADGIRTLLRALTKALSHLDAEPREDTITLANTLRNSLDDK